MKEIPILGQTKPVEIDIEDVFGELFDRTELLGQKVLQLTMAVSAITQLLIDKGLLDPDEDVKQAGGVEDEYAGS